VPSSKKAKIQERPKETCDLMPQFSDGASRFSADLPEALGLDHLTEEHGSEMIPGTVAVAIAFGTILLDQMIELPVAKQLNPLTEKARTAYHGSVLLVSLGFRYCWRNNDLPEAGHFNHSFQKSILDKTDLDFMFEKSAVKAMRPIFQMVKNSPCRSFSKALHYLHQMIESLFALLQPKHL